MTKLEDIGKPVTFVESSHKYSLPDGTSLTSVSSILSNYKNEFDPDGHIIRACARKAGVTVEEIRAKWDKERDDACDRGHRLHSQLEHYVNTGKILDADFKDVVLQFSDIKFTGKLFSEIRLFSSQYKIAGTTDLVEWFSDNTVNIGDFKQNKKIAVKSKYNKKLLYPLDKFDECEFEIYTFQLNLYALMLREHGFKTKDMKLYYIPPSTRKLEIYDIPRREKETLKLLKHFVAMRDF